MHAAIRQHPTQFGEHEIHTPVHVERRREVEEFRDFLRREVVGKAKLQEELIPRGQSRELLLKGVAELRLPDGEFCAFPRRGDEVVPVDLLGNQVLQPPACGALLIVFPVPPPAVPSPIEVEAQAPGDDDEPCRELTSWIQREFAKTRAILLTKVLEDVRVRIHRVVMRRRDGPRHVEEETGMLSDECTPRGIDVVTAVLNVRGQEARERARKVDHSCGGNGGKEAGGWRDENADCVTQVKLQRRACEALRPARPSHSVVESFR